MEAVGVGSITNSVPLYDEAAMRRDFPGIQEGAVRRLVGAARLLICMTERQLHSQEGIKKGKLLVSKTPLGCGEVITGVAALREEASRGERLSAECRALQGATTAQPVLGRSFHVSAFTRATDSILELGELGLHTPPLCKTCKGCGECRFGRENCSEEERMMLDWAEQEMVLENGQLKASYLWLLCAEKMRSNRQQVEKSQQSLEARLIKKGLHPAYIKEFEKAVAEGMVVEVSREEIDNYKEPINYNNHFKVINENSSSTRL